MNLIAFLTGLGLVVTILAPAFSGDLVRVPHHHVLIGNVTDADLAAHLASESVEPNSDPGILKFRNGLILSIPFGDWAEFFSQWNLALLPLLVPYLRASLIGRLTLCHPLMEPHRIILHDPPPRFV